MSQDINLNMIIRHEKIANYANKMIHMSHKKRLAIDRAEPKQTNGTGKKIDKHST